MRTLLFAEEGNTLARRNCLFFLAATVWCAISVLPAPAGTFTSAATGNYNANNSTWGNPSGNPGGNTPGDAVTVSGFTVTVTVGDDANGDTVTISTPGILYANNLVNSLAGASLDLDGGTLRYNTLSDHVAGGNLLVNSSSTLNFGRNDGNSTVRSATFGTLSFGPGTPTLSVTRISGSVQVSPAIFVANTLTQSGILNVDANSHVRLIDYGVANGVTVTKSGGGVLNVRGVTGAWSSGTLRIEGGTVDITTNPPTEPPTANDTPFASGAAIVFAAGAFRYLGSATFTIPVDVSVDSGGGVLRPRGSNGTTAYVQTFGKVSFTSGAGAFSIDTSMDRPITTKFVGSLIENNGTFSSPLTGLGRARTFELSNTAFLFGKTVTKAGTGLIATSGTLGVRLAGSADMLAANSFTLITSSGNITKGDTWDNSDSLWTKGGAADTITATLNNALKKGTFDVDSPQKVEWLPGENAGYVQVDNLVSGQKYRFELGLDASVAAAVAVEMAKNPALGNVIAASPDVVRFELVSSPVTGTGYFAWDNVHSLGANVVSFGPEARGGMVILLR